MNPRHKAHPWHGISPGENAPAIVTAFIEIVPSDTIKYEVDKASGYLKIDRPQKFSNITPTCTDSSRKHTARKKWPNTPNSNQARN